MGTVMNPNTNPRSAFALLLVLSVVPVVRAADAPAIRLGPEGKAVEVTGLAAADLAALSRLAPESDVWPKVFAVFVDRGDRSLPPVLGAYRVEGAVVRFEPRFPLVPGGAYRAVLDPSQVPGRKEGKPVEVKLSLPKPAPKPPTVVTAVYPTTDRLPENALRFYLHFSAPMGRGDSYRFITLLDAAGKPVESPFLEIDQELWDPEGKRLTLFIDPGRIKRGLKPREDLGPVLEEGKRYTLVIDRAWQDEAGNPLKEGFRKTFTAGPPDEKALDMKTWQLQPPDAGGRTQLTVVLPKPLDHALLQRLVWVEDDGGRKVAGAVTVGDAEKRWQFAPAAAWAAGKYRLVADTRLEDPAGNSLARPFEVDVFRPVQREVKAQTVAIPFEVRPR
jgi:hypothetical protein